MVEAVVRFSRGWLSVWVMILGSEGMAGDRIPWLTSAVVGSPEPPSPYRVERIYPKLSLTQPVELVRLGNSGRLLALEVSGRMVTFVADPSVETSEQALDLRSLHGDLARAFGIAVHPDFDRQRTIFVVYGLNPAARPDGNRLSRFRLKETQPPTVDAASEEILLTWPSGGHSGSAIRFDAAGFLYFSTGDGAKPFPPDEYHVGQDVGDLRSTICRIDIDHRDPPLAYRIPSDNPFVGLPGARPEVWAYGFRNPWRFSIDPVTQDLLCGDVGWELWELILRVERGGNYGWSLYEGPQKIRNDIPLGPTPIRKPLLAYPHTDGQSVTGGVVYRGQRFPELQGTYLYGDYVNGKLWGLRYEGDQVVWHALLADTGLPIISFHEDGEGEVIVVGFDGSLHRLMDNPELDSSREFPRVLSKTGIFRDLRKLEGEAGVAPYRLLATAYEGGATSTYHVAIPGSSQVELRQAKKQWVYPSGTVFAKTLSWPRLDGELPLHLETQLLRYNGKTWDPFSYAWREDQSDADLVGPEGGSVEWIAALVGKDRREYRIRSRAECRSCHHLQAGAIAGWDFANLGQASSSVGRSQLEELRAAGLIRGEVKAAWTPRAMVDPRDASANLTDRARSYLAIHCSQCHCRGGGGTVALELPYTHTLEQTNALQAIPTQGTFGLDDPQVIFPGDPYRSVLYYRLATCGSGHMPKLWDRDNDLEGIRLIHDWICSLADAGLSTPPAKRSAMPRRPGRDESSTRLEVAISSGDLGDDPTAVATTTAALRWLHAASAGQVSDQQRTVMLALAREHADPLIRGLWERLLPIGERTERLGNQISSETILSMQGDAAAGRQRFLASKSQQCRQCHRAEGQGRAVGPDLDGIGSKRSPAELLESVIDPSRRIEPAYASHQVLTVDGRVFTGILGESPSGEVRLRLADGSEQRLELDEIEERREGGLSLMPHGLAAEMTAEELADLIAYLASLTVIDSAGR